MAFKPTSLRDLIAHGFDDIIDVRSPAEFAEDHVTGAISLPVLDDEERARVGTIYKQQSPFLGRKIGAALVFKNAARHIEGPLAQHEGGWRPLVYCWRGGQRSGSFAWMLSQIGWRSEVLDGGYKTFRRLVTAMLYDTPLEYRLIMLGGYTGTAKTDLLARLAVRGVQILDLEKLAGHRGSLLGETKEGQPSQKMFETRLAMALLQLDPARPVVVEAESSKIGRILLPPSLWAAMCSAPWIDISAPIEARARYLVRAYEDILSDTDRLTEKLNVVRRHRGHAIVDGWMALIAEGDKVGLTRALMQEHYDPSYNTSMKSVEREFMAQIRVPDLSEHGQDDAADQIAEIVAQASSI
ncbi:MAG: tRNA 2-selenouridine(34) synthase MnmH [Pseudomonadota bacterium]|nr:tRNA 2-selenouridine(34) synthase MnmH [Pseudomonadota bacterium]